MPHDTRADPARQYARLRYRIRLMDMALNLAVLAAFQWSGASLAVARWWSARFVNQPLVILGYLAVFGACSYAVTLPLHFYSTFLLEHRFGLSRMTPTDWLVRELKQLAVGAVLGAAIVEGFYAMLRHAPRQWPLLATLAWVALTVVLARAFPTVLLPMFYKTTPVRDDALVQRLVELCRRVGVEALGVFRFELGKETRKANAALAGLGKTRRVLLSDTLMAEFSPEEIEGVLAHELAHHHYRHIVKMLCLSAAGSWIALTLTDLAGRWWVPVLGLRGLSDIAGCPAVMLWLSLLGCAAMPFHNGLSRYFEWQSDRFAVRMTIARPAFASALRRLAALNLADPHPPRWVVWLWYDHPPIAQRIEAAERAAA